MIKSKIFLIGLVILTTYILSALLTPTIINYFQIDSLGEPEFRTYRSDESSFIKTFYLMKKGESYYSAFYNARSNFIDGNLISGDPFTWRMPTVFYLWNFAESGENILTLFIFFSILAIFLILKQIIGLWALMGPVILIPYFYDALTNKTSFLFTEWWALFFFIFALAALFYNYSKTAILMFTLSVLTRELYVIPLLILSVYGFFRKDKFSVFFMPIVISSVGYLIHWHSVSTFVENSGLGARFIERFHGYSLQNLQQMISFSMRGYVLDGLKTHYLLIFTGVMALILNLILERRKEVIYLATASLSLLFILPVIGVLENDYWGILFVPLILISIPLLFNLIKKLEKL